MHASIQEIGDHWLSLAINRSFDQVIRGGVAVGVAVVVGVG